MKKVYILGGYGTKAGIDIIQKMINIYEEQNSINSDSDYIKFCLDSHPSQYNHINEEECLDSLLIGLQRVKYHYNSCNDIKEIIVGIGCNTMHICMEKYLSHEKLPGYINFISIQDVVAKKMKECKKNIFLWSTKETYNKKLYHKKLQKYNLNIEYNLDIVQNLLEKLIYQIKFNKNYKEICFKLKNLIKDNCIIILGCTELPYIIDDLKKCFENKNIDFLDCNYELAKEIVDIYQS